MIQVSNQGILTSGQVEELTAVSTSHRVKALFENPSSKSNLQEHVRACVDTPNTICIGVSPALRFTWTEIGTDSGIKSSDFQQVGRAGNSDFRAAATGSDSHGWVEGVKAIVSRAEVLRQSQTSATAVIVQKQETVVEHPVPYWPFVVGGGALLLLAYLCWRLIRKQQDHTARAIENLENETFEAASRNLKAPDSDWSSKIDKVRMGAARNRAFAEQRRQSFGTASVAGAPSVNVVQGSNSSDLLTGMVIGQSLSDRSRSDSYSRPSRSEDSSYSRREESYSSGGGSDWGSSSSGGGGGDFGGGDSGGGGGGVF